HNGFGPEEFFRNVTGGAAMPGVIRVNRIKGCQNVVHGLKCEESLTCRYVPPEAGILADDGAPRGQVASIALAKPSTPQTDVLILCNCELAARCLDVIPITPRVQGERLRIDETPPIRFKLRTRIRGHPHRCDRLPARTVAAGHGGKARRDFKGLAGPL